MFYKEQTEKKLNDTKKHIEQLEKRINSIADFIQGPYTEQINNQIKALASAYSKLEIYVKFKTKKDKKCSGSKQSKK